MPYEVVARVADHLSSLGIPSSAARLLVLGLAYKKNVDDCRESPAIKISNFSQTVALPFYTLIRT